ncbi:MAG: 30S ribosomal protein S8 [Candidatus Omnitrophica bacterium]|nr:30S ribosomal protein S8 [Candidatus Omnitrophota bacterium]
MSITDPIADMLTVLKNGSMVKKETVEVRKSGRTESVLSILKKEGFISNYKAMDDARGGSIKVYLRYEKNGTPALTGLKRISRPGRRVYTKADEIKSVYSGLGIAIISTSKGVVSDKEAREKSAGGEIMCHVW